MGNKYNEESSQEYISQEKINRERLSQENANKVKDNQDINSQNQIIQEQNVDDGNKVSMSRPLSREYYLVPFDDFILKEFLVNKKSKKFERHTNCEVKVLKKIVNRKIIKSGWIKYAVIEIVGPNDRAVNACLSLLDQNIAGFSRRRVYHSQASMTLFTSEDIPDNKFHVEFTDRIGFTDTLCHDLTLFSPLALEYRTDIPDKLPWKITSHEKMGYYTPNLSKSFYITKHVYPEIIETLPSIPKTVMGKFDNKQLEYNTIKDNNFITKFLEKNS